ncbi:RNA-binding protein 43 [Scomber scombrus]|uniref:RNA-binding protein 43 n=1 Tax=Scomber scombrus TaxID=13677 RepID=UPI002DD82680|nr:RNA-binding protein 43 [Scomber scombrus]
MENRRNMVEVLGVPEVLPADRIVEKLEAYFLSGRNGGGEVLKVLYPCYQLGQAFIIFERLEVAARVLRKSPHMLEVNHQQYCLTVKAADIPEMNLPVEATLNLKHFPDKTMVRKILKSHSFTLTDLNSDQVRVKGSFSKLRDVKAHLEQLQNQTRIPPSSSPVQSISSGAISKHYTNHSSDVSDGKGNQLKYRDKPSPASPSSPATSSSWRSGSFQNRPASAESRAAFSQRPDQSMSLRRGTESFVVDADVFTYARRFRKKDFEVILDSHIVRLEEVQVGNNMNITLQGKNAKMAAGKLQSLLNDLSKSLRTQEVLLKDMDRDSQALLEKIRKDKNIYKSVFVCMMSDRLHLIGPSGESYELKQRLSGRPGDHSGRTGRTFDRDSKKRSHSLPPLTRKTAGRERDAIANPSPVVARGYSLSKYQEVEEDGDEPELVSTGCFGQPILRRNQSMSRVKNWPEKSNDHMQEKKTERTPRNFWRKPLLKISGKDIKQQFKRPKK